METSKNLFPEDNRLRFSAAAYYVVVLVAFTIGLYGLFSLFWLAGAELQQSVHVVGSLQ
jgi:hypothetical protein